MSTSVGVRFVLAFFFIFQPWHYAVAQNSFLEKLASNLSLSESAQLLRLRSVDDADDEAMLSSLAKLGRIRRLVDFSEANQIEIRHADGPSMRLSELVTAIRRPNTEFYQTAVRASQALASKPELIEVIAETDDAFVIASGVRLLVKDPDALARASQEFRETIHNRGLQGESLESLAQEDRKLIESFLNEEAAKLTADHPLASFAKQGNAALFEAIQKGYGEFSITETVTFAKLPLPVGGGRIQHPSFERGVMDFSNLRPLSIPIVEVSPPQRLSAEAFRWLRNDDDAQPQPSEVRETTTVFGEKNFRAEFLTGFTIGNAWQWSKKWDFWVGYFEISLGAGYEFGMRFPLAFEGKANPTMIRHSGRQDVAYHFDASMRMIPFDGNADFYRQIGVPNSRVFEGKEFVLGASAHYRVKLRAFRRNFVNHSRQFGFDYGQHLTPPSPDRRVNMRLEIPAHLTGTRFDLGVLSGSAQFGLLLGLEGKASITSNLAIERLAIDQHAVTHRFNTLAPVRIHRELAALTLREGQERARYRYGLRLSDPKYHISATMTPSVRGQLRSHVPGFRKTFNTSWIDLNRFKIDLGNEIFGAHAGTPNYRDIQIGTKEFYLVRPRPSNPSPAIPEVTTPPTENRFRAPIFIRPELGKITRPKGSGNKSDDFTKGNDSGTKDKSDKSSRLRLTP